MSTIAVRVVGLPLGIAERLRRTRRDDHGNELVATSVTEAPGTPCRVCLRDAAVGDQVLLASHSPFAAPHPYRTVGPIFVHAAPCPPFEGAGVPEAIRRRLLSVRAHDRAGALLDADVVAGDALADLADRLLARPGAHELHVHHARPGCFACKIVRP